VGNREGKIRYVRWHDSCSCRMVTDRFPAAVSDRRPICQSATNATPMTAKCRIMGVGRLFDDHALFRPISTSIPLFHALMLSHGPKPSGSHMLPPHHVDEGKVKNRLPELSYLIAFALNPYASIPAAEIPHELNRPFLPPHWFPIGEVDRAKTCQARDRPKDQGLPRFMRSIICTWLS
jgi:hypothetical protein